MGKLKMKNIAKEIESDNDEFDDDDFNLDSEDEAVAVAVKIPGTTSQSKPIPHKEEQVGKGTVQEKSEVQSVANKKVYPTEKEKLLEMLMNQEQGPKPAAKRDVPALYNLNTDLKKAQYEGKEDPDNPENEIDFKKAYYKLVNSLSGKEDQQILLSEIEMQKAEEERQKQENAKALPERTEEFAKQAQKKRELIKEEMEEKRMKECTFAPKNYTAHRKKNTR
eukprot:TRINITY_DN3702_c0_g1_i4.p1 TRINITY_DN3702_c0_g1~~TRINITY_DN3702_c0_g1_i4.p1  ORF type:complete len:222 (+),score=67.02 TRINITY_DN3702_c0_g1_i4:34-699(+)